MPNVICPITKRKCSLQCDKLCWIDYASPEGILHDDTESDSKLTTDGKIALAVETYLGIKSGLRKLINIKFRGRER